MEGQGVPKEIRLQKVGIQILSDEALANIFPDYQDLLDNIEKCRDRIRQVNKKGHYQYNLMYDNVFSIIGKRGTGKTSAIFTLKKKIEESSGKDQIQDLLLPIIMPELFAGKDGILDWILAGLEEEVCKIEKKYQEDYSMQFDQACRYKMDKETHPLRKQYERLLEQKFSGKYRVGHADSYYEAIGNSTKQVKNSYNLMRDIYKFWDILIESRKKTMKRGMNEDKEPLIYFFFDDVDLSPDKVEELLTAIRVYLAHPSLIVIITADEDVFLEVIENKMDEKMGRLHKDQRKYLRKKTDEGIFDNGDYMVFVTNVSKENTEDGLSDMARMYLGKILPPSTRYYLRIFEHPEEKRNFVCSVDDPDKQTVTLFQLLIKQINYLIWKDHDRIDNFLQYEEEEIIFYLEFIGDTARQISNEIWIINTLVNNLRSLQDSQDSENEMLNHIFNYVYSFLHTTFVNNHRILGVISNIDVFLREIIKKEYNDWKLYINYNFVNQYFEKYRAEHEDREELINEIGMKLYAVLYFVENILLILEKSRYYQGNRKKIHGLHHFIEFLSIGGFDTALLRSSMKLDEFLNHYGNLLINIEDLKDEDSDQVRFIRKYLYKFAAVKHMDISLKSIFKWYSRDQRWLKKISQLLFLYFEHIYIFDKESVEKSLFIEKEGLQFAFEEKIAREMRAAFERFIATIGIKKEAERQYELIQKAFHKLSKKDGRNRMKFAEISEEKFQKWLHQKKYHTVTEVMDQIDLRFVNSSSKPKDWEKALSLMERDDLENLLDKRFAVSECQDYLLQVRAFFEFVKDQIKYIVILDIDEVLRLLKALQEYREGEYAFELQNFVNAVNAYRNGSENILVLERSDMAIVNFLRLMREIDRDAQTGRIVVKKSYADNYAMYSNICKEIFRHIDLGIASKREEPIFVLQLCIAVYRAKIAQHFLYIGMTLNNMHEIIYNQSNIYFDLYKFIKDEILTVPPKTNEQIILRNQIEKWIAESRKDYINKIMPNEAYREKKDE